LRDARTCYGHFAGRLGVALTDAMLRQTWIESHDRESLVTPRGTERFRQLGIDPARLRRGRRGIAYPCLDWSERRHHLAGPLATELVKLALARDWVRRLPRSRAVKLTPLGRRELHSLLGMTFSTNV
jgi:hypothetical protein